MYIYTHEHSESSPTKIKHSSDPVNKGNQKLYLPVKNKTNMCINWKTILKQGAMWRIKQ